MTHVSLHHGINIELFWNVTAHISQSSRASFEQVSVFPKFSVEGLPTLPTAPGEGPAYQPTAAFTGASSGPSRPLPDHPPFKVFIGNIPYDASEGEMADVFTPLQVRLSHSIHYSNVQLLDLPHCHINQHARIC